MAEDLGDQAAARPDARDQRAAAARARLVGSLSELADVGVRAVRLQYADLHGICRGKLTSRSRRSRTWRRTGWGSSRRS